MRLALLAGVAMFTIGTAQAQVATPCIDVGGITYCDPAAFHVTGPGAGATKDPVIIQSTTQVDIFKNSGGAAIDKPLDVFFAVPLGGVAPTLSGAFFNASATSDTFSAITQLPGTFSSGDLYSFVGCPACDNSENFGNFNSGLTLAGLPTTAGFTVYKTEIDRGFALKDDTEHLIGSFAVGTYIVPLASNTEVKNGKTTVTFFDAAFTETGLIDGPPTPPRDAPEPMTLAMLGVGILGLGFTRRR